MTTFGRRLGIGCSIVGVLTFAGIAGLVIVVQSIKYRHHYQEIETFFRGSIGNRDILGISFFDYYGVGIMEGNQWKVESRTPDGEKTILYQSHSPFQEAVPHQPAIQIVGNQIEIDDGLTKLSVTLGDSAESGTAPNQK